MKFLCLAYGDGKDWAVLTEEEQGALLANDEVLRQRGATVAMVGPVTTVRAWDGTPTTSDRPCADAAAPLAGFSVIDARDLAEAVELVAGTPCAVAKGAIEIRPIVESP